MKRARILIAAVGMQTCLGATYAWAVFVPPLRALTGLSQGALQLPFSLFYVVFPLTMVLSGTLLPRLGPRRCAVFGGCAFGAGWLLAGLGGTGGFALTVAGIGLLAGVGVGFAYIVPIATCIRWFPRHRGLVTGIAVAGFGGGAALVSQAAGYLMKEQSLSPFGVFGRLGLVFLLLVVIGGAAMENPPAAAGSGPPRRAARLPLSRIRGRRLFWVLYAAMFTGLAAGFAVNANLRDLCPGIGVRAGVTAVSLFAVTNALGRLLWGGLFDRLSPRGVLPANLLCQAALLLGSPWILRSEAGLLGFACIAGLNYGGVLVIYASSAAGVWGNDNVGQVYGWLFSSNAPAALAPLLAGLAFDRSGEFIFALRVLGLLLLAAALWAGRALVRPSA